MRVHSRRRRRASPRKRTTGHSGGSVTGASIVAALEADSTALSKLTNDLASNLLSSGFTAEIIQAIIAVVNEERTRTPGQWLAGTISTLTGALQLNGSGQPIIAMVFLNGASTAVPVYIPTHLRSQVATGQEVWVVPVNGNMDDLIITSLRAIM